MKKKTAFAWIWSYVKKYQVAMFIGLTLSVVVAGLNLINPLVTGQIVDEVIKNQKHALLAKLLLIMICTTFGKAVIRYTYQVIFEHCSQNVILYSLSLV